MLFRSTDDSFTQITGLGNDTGTIVAYIGIPVPVGGGNICSPECYNNGFPLYQFYEVSLVNAQGEDVLAPGWNANYSPTFVYSYLTTANASGIIAIEGIPVGTYTIEINDVYDNCPILPAYTFSITNTPGCTDPNAVNYCALCNVDDGSCL